MCRRESWARFFLAMGVITTGLACDAGAEEGGTGHYLPGAMASFADGIPPEETFVVRYNMVDYDGSLARGQPLPIAGLRAAGVRADFQAHGLSFLWRPPLEIGENLSYALSTTIPFVTADVAGDVTSAGGATVRRSDSEKGLGDIVFMPLMLNCAVNPDLNASFRVGVYAPTGDYETGRLANTGKNYWTIEPTVALMYFGRKNGREASLFAGADFNTENEDTDYRSGTQVHLDGTLAQHLPLFGGLAGIGVSGFWYQQVEGDSGEGAVFGDFKAKTTGFGPVLSFVKGKLVAELKWLHELDTENRLEGDFVWLKVVAKF